jgi:hypothetical protein
MWGAVASVYQTIDASKAVIRKASEFVKQKFKNNQYCMS